MPTVNVRYIVDDVDAAVAWYTKHLGFTLLSNAAPAFADVTRGSLRLLLSGPTSSAGRAMRDGDRPRPGGWNRIHLIVDIFLRRWRDCARQGSSFATIS
jgi:catechol 2,3-dioxygenase-like lactoylglutathione lyase family enzyme